MIHAATHCSKSIWWQHLWAMSLAFHDLISKSLLTNWRRTSPYCANLCQRILTVSLRSRVRLCTNTVRSSMEFWSMCARRVKATSYSQSGLMLSMTLHFTRDNSQIERLSSRKMNRREKCKLTRMLLKILMEIQLLSRMDNRLQPKIKKFEDNSCIWAS